MEIRRASAEKDFLDIRHIWEERFTTDRNYLDTMFKYIFPLCRSYIYVTEGKAVSVISLMPMNYVNESAPLKGYYMFGVATLKEYEGKKLAAGLILHASGLLTIEGYDFIFERPANQSLNKYYFNLGFTVCLPKVPHAFPFTENHCSPENNHRNWPAKTLSEAVLESIIIEHPRRFEWADSSLTDGLLRLGELKEHMNCYSPTPDLTETYIAIKPLSAINPGIFEEAFFCFPME